MTRFLRTPVTALAVLALAAVALAFAASAWSSPASPPRARAAAVCADYPDQAAAQRAADTRDPDGDGIYCEDLPCPCAEPGQTGGGGNTPAPAAPAPAQRSCRHPSA